MDHPFKVFEDFANLRHTEKNPPAGVEKITHATQQLSIDALIKEVVR